MLRDDPLQRNSPKYPASESIPQISPEQIEGTPTVERIAPWDRAVREERANLEVLKLRRARAALVRAEREEREEREREREVRRSDSARHAADTQRLADTRATENARLDALRTYGRQLSWLAPHGIPGESHS